MGWYQKQKRIYESRQQNHVHDLPEDEVVHSEPKKEDMTKMEESKDAQQPVKPQESASLIGEHTEVTGDVSTDDDLTIYGRVKGNIKCSKRIQIYGSVEGDILCQDASVIQAEIHGNIECKETLKISQESTVEGNITTTALENGGAVRGDIHAGGHIRLSEKSQVSGDITASSISVDQGAVIQGCVMIGIQDTNGAQKEA